MQFSLFSIGLVSGLLAAFGAIWLGAGPGLAAISYAAAASLAVLGSALWLAHLAQRRSMPVRAQRGLHPPPPPPRRR